MHYIKLFSGHHSHTNAYGVEVRTGNDAPASLGRNGWYAAIENYKNDGHLAITYVGDGDRDTARAGVWLLRDWMKPASPRWKRIRTTNV